MYLIIQLASHDIEIPNSQEPNDQCLYKLHHNVILASRKPISTTGISAQLNATERELNEPAERLDKQKEYQELKNAREHIKLLKKAAIHGLVVWLRIYYGNFLKILCI